MASKLVLLLVATLAVLAALLGANPQSQALAAPVALPRPVPQDRACNEVSNAEGDDPEAGGCSTVGGFTEPLVDILPPPEK